MNWLRATFRLFFNGKGRSRRDIRRGATLLANGYITFMEKAREAGFTGPQADFMWDYLSLSNHNHREK